MPDVIVSSVFIRLRHPVHEAGQTNVFDATTQEWITDSDGKVVAMPEKGPFTPQQLDAKGLTMPVIVNQALQTAMRDRVEALASVLGITAERDAARAETAEANTARDAALAAQAAAEAALAQCQSTGQAMVVEAVQARKKAEAAAAATADELARISQEKADEVANPLLNVLSFGLFGKS